MLAFPHGRGVGPRRKALFFCPEAAVRPHFYTMALLARSLVELGHDVRMAACAGGLKRCVAKVAAGLAPGEGVDPAREEEICADCRRVSARSFAAYGLPSVDPADWIDEAAARRADEIVAAAGDRPETAEIDGVKIGLFARADLLLRAKLMPDEPLEETHQADMRGLVHTAAVAYIGVKALLQAGGYTDIAVFNLYAVNAAAASAAWGLGLQARVIANPSQLGVDRRYCWISPAGGYQTDAALRDLWPQWRACPLTADEVATVGDDVLFRLDAASPHVYSAAKSVDGDMYAALNFSPDRPVVAVYTSSPDECFAAEAREQALNGPWPVIPPDRIFDDQIDWLTQLLDFARRRSDMQFAVRIHPREDANKRDGRRSTHFRRVTAALTAPPDNVRVLPPTWPLSSYDLLEIADVVLTSWSTIGIEAARMGAPTLAALPGFAPCPTGDFIAEASSPAAYFDLLERMSGAPADMDNIKYAFRWHYIARLGMAVPWGDAAPLREFNGLPPWRPPAAAQLLETAMFGPAPLPAVLIPPRLGRPSDAAARIETEATAAQLRRLIHVLFTGRDVDGDYRLLLDGGRGEAGAVGANAREATLRLDGTTCVFNYRGAEFSRRSPLIRRIAPAAAN